jgi:DNA replication protein DnaC
MMWVEEAQNLKANINEDVYFDKIHILKTVEVLYIDDFFKTGEEFNPVLRRKVYKDPTAADIRLAFEIINYRYNNKRLITIISCERFIDELLAIDGGVASRIYERTKNGTGFEITRDLNRNYRMKRANGL